MKKLFRSLLLTASLAVAASPAHSLEIIFNDTTPGGSPADVLAGFEAAATIWESIFSDDVTVRVDIGFTSLPPGVLGSAGSRAFNVDYSTVRTAMLGDASSAFDATAVGSLENTADFNFVTRNAAGTGNITSNAASGTWDTVMRVNSANLKALGLYADDGVADAAITFSSDFAWDFDRSDGIDATAFDFIGVAAHEIGHALGFVSGVDIVDFNIGCCSQQAFVNTPLFSVLDLFKYSEGSLELGGLRDLTLGNLGDVWFSLDGATQFMSGTFATGRFNCANQTPCQQASHWEDRLGLGIMDPTAARGELLLITDLDRIGFDVIGWDVSTGEAEVPEPGPLTLLLFGLTLLILRRRIEGRA